MIFHRSEQSSLLFSKTFEILFQYINSEELGHVHQKGVDEHINDCHEGNANKKILILTKHKKPIIAVEVRRNKITYSRKNTENFTPA